MKNLEAPKEKIDNDENDVRGGGGSIPKIEKKGKKSNKIAILIVIAIAVFTALIIIL